MLEANDVMFLLIIWAGTWTTIQGQTQRLPRVGWHSLAVLLLRLETSLYYHTKPPRQNLPDKIEVMYRGDDLTSVYI